ncbi:MAG: CvpA family protein [Bacillota bacterium]
MNWLDVLFAAIIVWNVLAGAKNGLIKGMAKLLGLVAGAVAARIFYLPLADMVNLKWQLIPAIAKLLPGMDKLFPGAAAQPPPGLQAVAEGVGRSVSGIIAAGILYLKQD